MNNDKTLYQALIVEEKNSEISKFSRGIHTTLWTGTKDSFPAPIREGLPSNGATLDPDFLPLSSAGGGLDRENLAKHHGAINLLKYRKLSQLVAKSWLPDGSIIRKLILTADLAPDEYNNDNIPEDIPIPENTFAPLLLQSLSTVSRASTESGVNFKNTQQFLNVLAALPPIDERTLPFRSSVILPDGLNWRYIRLSLLCAGQAYLKVGNEYQLINEPIFSTYEICVNYAFSMVSWSEYIASNIELVQPGHNQIPPYYKAVFPYPPRPNLDEYSLLSEEDIFTWANAQESGGELPFYPPKQNGDYTSDLVTNVVPPYPYIPPTTG